MANCTDSAKLASDKLWGSVKGERYAVLIIGFFFAGLSLALYGLLIHRHAARAKKLVSSQAGAHFVPAKFTYQERMLYLGPIMIIFFVMQMCAPELTVMAELFQNTYKAFSYYFLMRFTAIQLGMIWNAIRDDGTGTMQQHKPCKIWKQPPCCCVWVFFLRCMKVRTFSNWDAWFAYRLTLQYCVLGPVTSCIKMLVVFEGVSRDRAFAVNLVADIVGLMSILFAVYANKVYSSVVEACPTIQHTVKQRSWFNHGKDLGCGSDPLPKKNIGVKNAWISLATVLPIMAGIVVSLVVKDDLCLDNGDVLPVEDRRNYIIAFIGILINFLAALFAFAKAFPVPGPTDRTENLETVATKFLEMEIWPAFIMETMPACIEGIIEERKKQGKDPDLGVPSTIWRQTFGDVTEGECTGLKESSQSDSTGPVSAESIGAEKVNWA